MQTHPTNKAIKVYVRLMFLRLGEIDTLNDKYQAQVSIEARWAVKFDNLSAGLSSNDQKHLTEGKSITLLKYGETHWHPQLYIENALGDVKEQIRYSARKSKEDSKFYVCEHRDVKGLFWEKLELQYFPSDVQDLAISVASMFYNDKVILLTDPYHHSGVNREAFLDQQKWSLYQHVDIQQRSVKEFLLEQNDKENDDDDDEQETTNNTEDRKRSIITFTCHTARRSNYFYWNGYFLILLINVSSFCAFALPPSFVSSRIQISCTLLLASITFRWTVNRSLPTISYLTSLDKYAIMCMFTLVFQSIWHSVIGAIIFFNTPENRLALENYFVRIDHIFFFGIIGLFVSGHIAMIMWLCLVPLKHRRNMKKAGARYERLLSTKKTNQNSTIIEKDSATSSSSSTHILVEQ